MSRLNRFLENSDKLKVKNGVRIRVWRYESKVFTSFRYSMNRGQFKYLFLNRNLKHRQRGGHIRRGFRYFRKQKVYGDV